MGKGRGSGGGGEPRSAEAREAARREREARRAAREGRAPADLPPLTGEHEVVEPGAPVAPIEPGPAWDEPVHPEPEWHEPAAAHPEPAAPAEPEWHEPEPAAPAEPEWHDPEPASPHDDPPTAAHDFFDAPGDEPFAADPAPVPDPVLEPPARPVIPPRPALSWEQDGEDAEPTRVDHLADDPPLRRPVTARSDVELESTDDIPAVRVLGPDDPADRPLGTKRVSASALASAAGAQGPPRFGAPPRGTPRSRRGMRRIVPAFLVLVLLVAAYGANKIWQPFHGDGHGRVQVVVPEGSGAKQIGDQLVKAGVVDNATIFSLRARLAGKRDRLRSGVHVLKLDMSYGDAIDAMTAVPKAAATVTVAIPEGLTIKQIASIAHRAQLRGSYTKATRSVSAMHTARQLGAPANVKTLEGFFFPDTYQLRTTASTGTLVKDQLQDFKRQTAGLSYAYAKSKQLTRYDVLIIASLIENEAQLAKDRPLIAAVIYNRLKQGIPLQIDATTRYETGNYGANARPIRQSELDARTPYNTRNQTGLPPTPISNPGLAALKAAARPAKVPYLYYVVKPCGHGAHAFSSTDAQFQKDVAAYNAKRDQLGGKDPSSC
ncbi:endolytic transglycosylase MltG [Paraconexibacter antarcticus]|uniref:Endolytic murein transglycosylase n=1 Tax=Paraconexibacter antarcticus TaxID=2949664 RepID=A0ABY5DP67_9ACTN|nr:endolytic transglycosylase MltG [Paraconexibacter antarcticus]UTI62535.1 endolytic transglycosylase MltG [Paraconexibacter antarcticus]